MAHRSERFERVFFPESVIREAFQLMPHRSDNSASAWGVSSIDARSVKWGFDNEVEFFTEYRSNVLSAQIRAWVKDDANQKYPNAELTMDVAYHGFDNMSTTVTVTSANRDDLLPPFAAFRNAADKYRIPEPPAAAVPPLRIFIGHGGSQDYRDLKDALQDHHKYEVETFETSPRGGRTIPDVIEGMAQRSTLALLVMTAEDEQADGSIRARENVVHEIGYFQGRLGRERAIVIMEDGVNEFSNMHGIVHLPYKNIREVVGDVLAIIKREFPHLSK